MPDRPTGFVCFNDLVAFGTMSALRTQGLEPGRDFGVVGIGGTDEAMAFHPALTAVLDNSTNIGAIAAETLLNRLSDPACRYAIAHELGHVASGLPQGSILIEGKPHTKVKGTTDEYEEAPATEDQEDVAEKIAMEWGFTGELTTWLKEDEDQSR